MPPCVQDRTWHQKPRAATNVCTVSAQEWACERSGVDGGRDLGALPLTSEPFAPTDRFGKVGSRYL